MPDLFEAVSRTVASGGQASSAQAWFAGGERVGYDPQARAIVTAQDAPLRIFLRQEGDPGHAVSFLPGFPDGSFGWTKVRPHLPNAAVMPKLFLDYVGMGDSEIRDLHSAMDHHDGLFYLAAGAGFVADHQNRTPAKFIAIMIRDETSHPTAYRHRRRDRQRPVRAAT